MPGHKVAGRDAAGDVTDMTDMAEWPILIITLSSLIFTAGSVGIAALLLLKDKKYKKTSRTKARSSEGGKGNFKADHKDICKVCHGERWIYGEIAVDKYGIYYGYKPCHGCVSAAEMVWLRPR